MVFSLFITDLPSVAFMRVSLLMWSQLGKPLQSNVLLLSCVHSFIHEVLIVPGTVLRQLCVTEKNQMSLLSTHYTDLHCYISIVITLGRYHVCIAPPPRKGSGLRSVHPLMCSTVAGDSLTWGMVWGIFVEQRYLVLFQSVATQCVPYPLRAGR